MLGSFQVGPVVHAMFVLGYIAAAEAGKRRPANASSRVLGPILATFLKLKGYDPIVYERVEALGDAGPSLWCASSAASMVVQY